VSPLATSQVRDATTFGIFKLTLHPSSYDWTFLPIAGSTFTDSGTGTVHAAPPPPGQTILHPGDALTPGQSITSPNGVHRLAMQSDGNLVAYDGGSVAWASGTNPAGAAAVMQSDGNFVVYNSSNTPLWASDTSGNPGAYFTVGNTGEFGVLSAGGSTTLWAPRQLSSGRRLRVGESVYSPADGYHLTMQTDGNLVEYNQAGVVVWASGTSAAGSTAVVQSDGNVVVYDSSHTAQWASDTSGHPGASLRLRDTGQLRVESASGGLLWAGPAELVPDRQLTLGQTLRSPTGAYHLTLQSDGNLVEYGAGNAVVWATGTSTGDRLTMQGDGNLVLYDNADSPLWASNTSGQPGASVTLLDGGQLVVADASGAALWAGPGALLHDRTLSAGDSFDSPTGAYQLTMQAGGNLVLHHGATVVWSSGTSTPGAHAVLQGDGNLVVYSGSTPLWASNTAGNPGAYLVVGDDGTIALISTAGGTLWSAG
jgi:exopolysaccharide biosynthesis protein